MSAADRRVLVLRNGVEIGRAQLAVRDRERPLGTHTFVLKHEPGADYGRGTAGSDQIYDRGSIDEVAARVRDPVAVPRMVTVGPVLLGVGAVVCVVLCLVALPLLLLAGLAHLVFGGMHLV